LPLRQGVNTILLEYQYQNKDGQATPDGLLVDYIEVSGTIPADGRGATLPYVEYEAENATYANLFLTFIQFFQIFLLSISIIIFSIIHIALLFRFFFFSYVGKLIGPDREYFQLPTEASQRLAVQLSCI
jgi:hypothetical protein